MQKDFVSMTELFQENNCRKCLERSTDDENESVLSVKLIELFREFNRGRSPKMSLQNFVVKMAPFDDGNNGILS